MVDWFTAVVFSALPLGLVLVVVALDPGKFLVSILIEALGVTLLSDPTKFMSGIIFLTNVNLSPSSNDTLAEKYANSAYEKVTDDFGWDTIAKAYSNLYKDQATL